MADQVPARGPWPERGGGSDAPSLEELLSQVAKGDHGAFETVYDQIAPAVYGVVRRVVRDLAQSEEVAQDVFVEVWRQASRYQADRGSALAWTMTLAHRRAVDRVRSAQSATDREHRASQRDGPSSDDSVADQVETRLEHEQVRRCLETLTGLQRESMTLAYYGGHSYRAVADLLDSPLGTVKTRLRDGLIRLRDCLGVGQ